MTTCPIIKKGPFGGDGGMVKDMDPTSITRIVKITIRHGKGINALIVCFERNDSMEFTEQWGGHGGRKTEINLKPDEYITSVRGYTDHFDNAYLVMSLVLETNLHVYGPYGTKKGKSFELPGVNGKIIGFHGRSGLHLDAIGVYVEENGPVKKRGPIGGPGDLVRQMNSIGMTRIDKISIRHDVVIDALIVDFERNGTVQSTDRWGGPGGKLTEINLRTNEYITSVKGYTDYFDNTHVVFSLVLETNLDTYGPYGTEKGKSFELPAVNGQIIGFHGRSNKYLDAIGVYLQENSPVKKRGPFGGPGDLVKEMNCQGITRIDKISIRHGVVIDALIVDFEHNGTLQSTDQWGGPGGNLTEIKLKKTEYITSVKGCIYKYYDVPTVHSLTLESNLGVYGPYGTVDAGYSFELYAVDGQINAFHARFGQYLNAIGVYDQGIIRKKSVLCGGRGGLPKDMDHPWVPRIIEENGPVKKRGPIGGPGDLVKELSTTGITRIDKISIRHGVVIDALMVDFERNGTLESTDQWGRPRRNLTEIKLKTNEYITSVKGNINGYMGVTTVHSLTLESNLHVYGPYGTVTGESFELPAVDGQIIGFHARFGEYLTAIGVYDQGIIRKKSVLCGGRGGLLKDMDHPGFPRISKVSISHGDAIDAFSVCYELEDGKTECTSFGDKKTRVPIEINLKKKEYIKSVRGYVGFMVDNKLGSLFIVRSLELISNSAHYGPYGKGEGTPFELSALDGQIIGFYGCSGAYLDAIGVYARCIRK